MLARMFTVWTASARGPARLGAGLCLHAALLVCFASAGAACLSDDALAIECAADADCAEGEVCLDRFCADRAAFEAFEADQLDALREPCPAGQERCGDNCVDLRTSLEHCGACDALCAAEGPNQRVACQAPEGEARCVRVCADGFADLDDAPGCEYACPASATRVERCDGIDNDCNGLVDAEDPRFEPPRCDAQLGVCEGALARCEAGAVVPCDALDLGAHALATVGAAYERAELACDGADNDCNGVADEVCCGEEDGAVALEGSEGMRVADVRVEGELAVIDAIGPEGTRRWVVPARGAPSATLAEPRAVCDALVAARGAPSAGGGLAVCAGDAYEVVWLGQEGAPVGVVSSARRPVGVAVSADADADEPVAAFALRVPEAVGSADRVGVARDGGVASAPWVSTASAPPVPAVAAGVPLVLEPDSTTASVVAYALDAAAAWTGESARWWSEADGLVAGARLEAAFGRDAAGAWGSAVSAGADGRDVLWRAGASSWDAPLEPAQVLGRADEVVRELRVIDAPDAGGAGVGVVARTVRGLRLFGVDAEARLADIADAQLADRAAEPQWAAAVVDGVWVVVHPAGRESGAALWLRRFGTDGGALCFDLSE